MWELSPKQKDFVMNCTGRYNLAIGSVRSGKTVAANFAFLRFAASDIPGPMVIIGRTEHSVRTNILTPFSDVLGRYFHYKAGNRKLYICGREIDVIGASDLKAEGKIRGATYSGALVDEATVIPEPVFKQLTYRLSIPNAKLFATTNPDSPYHWFKQQYIDREGDPDMGVKVWTFTFDDNPSLDEGYIRKIKAESQGLWYKRFIEGQWVLAEGAIYDFFTESLHCIDYPPNMALEYSVGIDYGTTNPCAFVLVGYNPNVFPQLWIEKEYYYDSKKANRMKTDSEYAEDLAKFVDGLPIKAIYLDPSAASFKAAIRQAGIQNLYDADNDVLNGIRLVTEYLANGTMKVCRSCTNVISEFSNYIWDSQAAMRGVERPLKQHDHAMDAARYVLYTRFKAMSKRRLTEQDMDRFHEDIYGRQQNLPAFFRTDDQPHPNQIF